ncbi:MFS transporter [Paenibacillus hexagrammi]|uniref:MFS transporter n=1 Tax=Paenibacillus hexagrammi TaxID=2908839 RepID=A0ABY3SGG5_9BACL|nr:MFS transporter [Paenibacillus sp. YPD9-1]UJF32550.1 MFS transporter [Paenibacillus sp. YPD9-1]
MKTEASNSAPQSMNDRIVMPIWTCGLFIVVMNTTMFNVSMPSIIGDLHITADLGSWIISSYSIGYALSTVIYSRLSDSIAIRRLLTVGLLVLGFSSVLGLFAQTYGVLLAARILQSAGAGAMAGLGLILASRYIPPQRRGRAIAMISAGSAMAFGIGPIAGGIITEYFGWNGLFGLTCLILLVLPVLLRLLPRDLPPSSGFDLIGASLTVANAVTLLLAVTQLSIVWLAVSAVTIITHVWHLRKGQDTFINPALLKNTHYRKLLIIGWCILIVNLGNLFLMPLALSDLYGRSPLTIGLTIAPGALLSAFLSRFVGRWIDTYGNRLFLLIAHALFIAVLLSFMLGIGSASYIILGGYLALSPAISAAIASLNNETSQLLPKAQIGSGMGLMQLIQFFGGSMSTAVCGLLLHAFNRLPAVERYSRTYAVLLAVSLCSTLVLYWYIRSARPATQTDSR